MSPDRVSTWRRLCIVQPVLKSYRLPFFLGLQQQLDTLGIELQVVYGPPWAEEAQRGDHVELPAPLGYCVPSRMLGGMLWMPALGTALRADAVIVEHANKHVLNPPLALAQRLGGPPMAYWGHGRDRQGNARSWGERCKRRTLHWADWWFAYTTGAADYVQAQGYDAARITTVGNAVDTRELRQTVAAVTASERQATLQALDLPTTRPVVVYCGSLYENKRLDLLCAAMDALQARQPATLIVIGGGPLAPMLQAYASTRPWVRCVGPKFGREKAVLLSAASLWLNPGLVGLGILDAFSAGLPLITTDLPVHSPEIEYLEPGVNGLMVTPDAAALTDTLCRLLQTPDELQALRAGALRAGEQHSIETMVTNFAEGVRQWSRSC